MQWYDSKNAGFTQGDPWMAVNPNYLQINAAAQVHHPDSVFACYQRLISLRKSYPVFVEGRFRLLLEQDQQIFAYVRECEKEKLLVCANFTSRPAPFSLPEEWQEAEILIQNYPEKNTESCLRPYEALIYRKTSE